MKLTKGDSYTIAINPTTVSPLLDLRVTIGGALFGSIKTNDLPKEGDLYVLRLTSEQTARIGSGDANITLTIETEELGVKKFAPIPINVSRSEDLYAEAIADEIYDLIIPITITAETATVGTLLYDLLRGEKGDKGDTGNVNFDDMTPEQRVQITPEIGLNDNWYINSVDTGKPSRGLQGVQGIQGLKGDTGTHGLKGDTGLQGVQGVKGDKGDTGLQGIQGIQVVKGDTGTTGAKGDKGDTGAQGIQGLKGDTGAQGLQGLKGDKGDTGATGAKGDTGLQGIQGIQGVKGDKGDTGAQGIQGVKGDTGKSAYEIYYDTTTDSPKLTENQWGNLTSGLYTYLNAL